jgi:hypothetical protein
MQCNPGEPRSERTTIGDNHAGAAILSHGYLEIVRFSKDTCGAAKHR